MGTITTDIPDLNLSLAVDSVNLLKEVSRVQISGKSLTAQVRDDLSDENYDEISKQLRIVFALSFEQVYSEDYEVRTLARGIGHHGHNERKLHLLSKNINFGDTFSHTSQLIFKDVLEASTTNAKQNRFLNLAYIWARAHELEDLKLLTEAFVQYWRILDEMQVSVTTARVEAILNKHELPQTQSNMFGARILERMNRAERLSAKGEILDLSNFDQLRNPHAHHARSRQKYYMEEETHIDAEIQNVFISDITKLFTLWQLDLNSYYLNPRANIYEIRKSEE